MNQNLNTQSKVAENTAEEMHVTASQVANFLQQNPDFFEHHLALLEFLTIPHPSGNAVSLISKQLDLFRSRHHDLKNKLNDLIEIAHENDALFSRMHELTLAMLETSSLEDLVANLHKVLADSFVSDFVALKIFQTYSESPIANLFVDPCNANLQLFKQEFTDIQPRCGKPTLAQAQFLFGESATSVKSSAIIPISFNNMQAIVAIGSRDKSRFHYSMGHLFLTQMGEIIGTRLFTFLPDKEADAHS
jgi:uncharacterized protein YigA (DUF484 family)